MLNVCSSGENKSRIIFSFFFYRRHSMYVGKEKVSSLVLRDFWGFMRENSLIKYFYTRLVFVLIDRIMSAKLLCEKLCDE